uniref:Reverse transcriptase domain-containing protein n=1 Tax=Tanacetum cinerariifolium TaxID=118510 RepID=A0A699GRD1_TANCI|nr:reverse transcriptase domain-containing protein [Tanacetum cinerariifolium]
MNPIETQQAALDNALVPSEKRLKSERCNSRIAFKEDLLTFIKKLGYSSKCDMLSTIRTDQMHQPWRTFVAVINKYISGKTIGLNRLRESRAQILLAMYNQMNVDYVALLYEDFMINLHTVHDDTLLDIKDSKAYKTYLDYATREVPPKKERKFKKPASPKLKIVPVSPKEPTQKGKRVKRPAKKAVTASTTGIAIKDTPDKYVSKKKTPAKADRGKGIKLLYDAALLEDAQLKKTLRKSKRETHKLQASGSSEGANFESKVPDELTGKTKDTSKGTGVKTGVSNMSKEDSSDSDDNSWGDSEDESDDVHDEDGNDDDSGNDYDGSNDAEDSQQTNLDDDENPSFTLKDYKEEEQEEEYMHTPEKDKSDDEEKMYEEEDDDTEGPLQSSSISSDFTSKLLNLDDLSPDINSLMNTSTVPLPIIPSSHPTTIPQQQTPDSTTTATYLTMTLPEIPNFASLFHFDQRVSALETKVSEFNQTSQFAKAISSIPGIVDNYLASKLKEEVNVVVRLQSNKLKEEAKAENQEFFNQVDSTIKAIIKEHVKAQVSKIMPRIKKYVTESLGAEVLVRSPINFRRLTYLEEIVVRRDDNVLYKFKEGDLPRLNLCDIEDMILLLVQKKLSNLDVDDLASTAIYVKMGGVTDWYQEPRVMSSPNHHTSIIEDAFSYNFPDYILASLDYVPASLRRTYSRSSNNLFGLVPIASPTLLLFHDDPYMKVMHAYYAKKVTYFTELFPPIKRGRDRSSSSTPTLPQEFEIGESSRKTSLERHEEQIEEILNHLDELSLDRIENMEDNIGGLGKGRVIIQQDFNNLETELQETRAQVVKPQRKQLGQNNKIALARFKINDLEQIIKEIQAPSAASASDAPAMNQAAISNCTEDCKVKFCTEASDKEILSQTEVQKMEDEFYHLTVKGNDLKTYVRRFQELATLCPTIVSDSKKKMEAFIEDLPRSIERNVTASKLQTLEEDINIAQRLMDQGCTLTLLNQPLKIDLMPIKLDSFDVVIGMDWLSKYHAKIICDKKVVRIPINDETLIIRDLPGLPPVRQVEFQIDLIPGAAPVAHAPYRLTPSEMQEPSDQLQELADRELRLDDKLNFVEEPVEVMDREVKQLKQSHIPIVKVRWNSKRGPEFTWERKDQIFKFQLQDLLGHYDNHKLDRSIVRSLYHPHQKVPETDPTEPPPAPLRNKGSDLEVDNLALEGVAPELAPSDFVSQNYETLATLMQEETKKRSSQSLQARLNFDPEYEASSSRHRKERRERDSRRPPVFTRIGKKVAGDKTADLQYLGTHKNNGWRTNVHARLGSRDVHDRLGRRRSLSERPPSSDSEDSRRKRRKRVSSSSSDSSDNEDEETGHWKSRNGYRNQEDEDMSRPWRRQKVNAFTRRISDFSEDKRRRMPANVKTYDGTGDPDDHLKIFESTATIKNWLQPVWCYMFNSTLVGNARN